MPLIHGEFYVERDHFMAYCDGVLLEFHHGAGMVVDELECAEAARRLYAGETVHLRLPDGRTTSVTHDDERDEFMEIVNGHCTGRRVSDD